MIRKQSSACSVRFAILLSLVSSHSVAFAQARGQRGMVATVHPIATEAGIAAFRDGGNAVDAAVSAALTLGVVDGHNSGLGGGCFFLVRTASGRFAAIDGRETAPAAATRDMFVWDGEVDPELSTTGPLAVGVPGALAAYEKAAERYGKLELSVLLKRAAGIAEQGFRIDRIYARNLEENQQAITKFAASSSMLLKADGTPYAQGDLLRLPDLARSYRAMARDGSAWFYRGELARRTSDWMLEHGGLLTEKDFSAYEAKDRTPIVTTYRGHEIVGFPPPSSGGIHVAQILNILEPFDMSRLLQDDLTRANHVIAEAMKLAFADRAHWLGDADFAPVPRGLVDKSYARHLASKIKADRAIDVPSHGLPPGWQSDVYGKHTTHIATADGEGNWVAVTATVNTSFGSKVVIPGTGVILNNEMDDFSALPGVPNLFGLVGAEANAVAPGKRPLSSMSPTIVQKNGTPILTVGAAGGPKIITQVVLAIVRFIDGKEELANCVQRPRIHHQWRPSRLFVEDGLEARLIRSLQKRGHEIEVLSSAGVCQAIARMDDGTFVGVADSRVPGKAAGL